MCAFDMLTLQEVEGGKTKCARYWPDQDVTDKYGGFAELNIIDQQKQLILSYFTSLWSM